MHVDFRRAQPLMPYCLIERTAARHSRLQTRFESLWGIPVVGGLERLDDCRASMRQLGPGEAPPKKISRLLGDSLARGLRLDRLLSLAAERQFAPVTTARLSAGQHLAEVSVAVAYDEVFNCYFPDTLDLLELQGASVRTFSPLHDEGIPEGTDVVYLGCGHPENADARLAANLCMKMSLCKHVFAGGRVYAEGGGLAYLCEAIERENGLRTPMVGLLPAVRG